jgi:hypothetical protein
MKKAAEGLPVSVQVRLVRHAREIGMDPNLVLRRFASERFLYRISKSKHADRFILKGALLMLVWLGETIRPTRDVDLLGAGDLSEAKLARIFASVCALPVEPDGLEFLNESVAVKPIRRENLYGGKRVTVDARLGNARLRVQVDVGIGDKVTPDPEWLDFRTLLDFPAARLRAYRPETSIAEKFHAMVELRETNSRMRDFFDIYSLAMGLPFDGSHLTAAISSTFERRRMPLPDGLPLALTPAFATSPDKQSQWAGFLRKSSLASTPPDLRLVVDGIAAFLAEPIGAAYRGSTFNRKWRPGGPWTG